MPCVRLMLNRPAARAAPVPPAQTSACARPAATARAAWTIDAVGFARTARTGSALLAIDSGASTISTPSGAGPSSAAGPNRITRDPRAAASAAPAATSAGPRSAPLQSTATTGSASTRAWPSGDAPDSGAGAAAALLVVLVLVLVIVARSCGGDDLAAGVVAA